MFTRSICRSLVVLAACGAVALMPEAPSGVQPSAAQAPVQDKKKEQKAAEGKGEEIVLFDGKSIGKWKETNFGAEGGIKVDKGLLILEKGGPLTGVHWGGEALPTTNYELTLEAMRIDGMDFFCGIAFPVDKTSASFVAGGWGGGICGISLVDGDPAADNETAKQEVFESNKWYAFRLRVTPKKIEVWLDERQIVDLELKDRQIDIHVAMSLSLPYGLTSFETTAAYRNVKLRKLN